MRFWVGGLGYRCGVGVSGFLRFSVSRLRVRGFTVLGFGFGVSRFWVFRFNVSRFGVFAVQGFWVRGLGLRVRGLGFRVFEEVFGFWVS